MEQVPRRLPGPKYKALGPQHTVQLGSRATERTPRAKLSAQNQKGQLRSRVRKAGQGAAAARAGESAGPAQATLPLPFMAGSGNGRSVLKKR